MAVELLKKWKEFRKDARLGKQRHESNYMAVQYFYNENIIGVSIGCVNKLELHVQLTTNGFTRCIPEQEKEEYKVSRTDYMMIVLDIS